MPMCWAMKMGVGISMVRGGGGGWEALFVPAVFWDLGPRVFVRLCLP